VTWGVAYRSSKGYLTDQGHEGEVVKLLCPMFKAGLNIYINQEPSFDESTTLSNYNKTRRLVLTVRIMVVGDNRWWSVCLRAVIAYKR
jgi:hypothetical protein